MPNLFSRLLSRGADKQLKEFKQIAQLVNDQEQATQSLSDEQLQHKTQEFKERFANGETLDALLPEAFAAVRELSLIHI